MATRNDNRGGVPNGARFIFGIFMVLFYIAVGIAFIFQWFPIFDATIGYIVGGILCAYGVWRGIRMFISGK